MYRRVRACMSSCHFSTVKDRAQTSQTEHWPRACADDHHTDRARQASTAPSQGRAAAKRRTEQGRSERPAALEGAAHRDLVGILEVAAHRQATREAGDA